MNHTQAERICSVILLDIKVYLAISQGSHLGPLLFFLFINYLPSIFATVINILLFADNVNFF